MTPGGIEQSDFESIPLNDIGVTVSRTPVFKSESNIDGDESFTDSTPEDITVYFHRRFQKWSFDKEGELEGGDALRMIKHDQDMEKNDKITYQDRTYRVSSVIKRYAGDTLMYRACNLFLIS